jgi:hypothetical protein
VTLGCIVWTAVLFVEFFWIPYRDIYNYGSDHLTPCSDCVLNRPVWIKPLYCVRFLWHYSFPFYLLSWFLSIFLSFFLSFLYFLSCFRTFVMASTSSEKFTVSLWGTSLTPWNYVPCEFAMCGRNVCAQRREFIISDPSTIDAHLCIWTNDELHIPFNRSFSIKVLSASGTAYFVAWPLTTFVTNHFAFNSTLYNFCYWNSIIKWCKN